MLLFLSNTAPNVDLFTIQPRVPRIDSLSDPRAKITHVVHIVAMASDGDRVTVRAASVKGGCSIFSAEMLVLTLIPAPK